MKSQVPDDIISKPKITKRTCPKNLKFEDGAFKLKDHKSEGFLKDFFAVKHSRDPVPKRVMTNAVSDAMFPGVPHEWLCDGRLLVLTDPKNEGNVNLFKVRNDIYKVTFLKSLLLT